MTPTEGTDELLEAVGQALAVLAAAPELNMSNYDHDDVAALNDGAIEAWQILDAALRSRAATREDERP